jgi:hypothetical protein
LRKHPGAGAASVITVTGAGTVSDRTTMEVV